MKKNSFYTLLIVALATLASCTKDKVDEPLSEFITINDASFEQQLIDKGIDSDGLINMRVLRTDVSTIERLDIGGGTISDLTGIEGFVNLKRLHAASNDLEAVDLSKNTLIDTLDLAGNILKTIDVSKNVNLKYVTLYGNKLTNISGFTGATNLNYLSLSFNYLTSFNLENPSLETLLIDNNDIVDFDTTNGINLKYLVLYTNKVKSIDLSNSLKLNVIRINDNKISNLILGQKDDLTYLSCSANFISNLDISSYANLSYLYAHTNPNLKCIKIADGQIVPTQDLSDYQQLNENCN